MSLQPFRPNPLGLPDSVGIQFDDIPLAANLLNGPIVLVLKNVENGPHDLKVRTTIDQREYLFASSLKLIDQVDFHFFYGSEALAVAGRAPDAEGRRPKAEGRELSASVGFIQASLVLREVASAHLALPACSTLARRVTVVAPAR